jgi:hypothetical protein
MIPRGLVVGGLSLRGVGGEVVMVGFLFGLLGRSHKSNVCFRGSFWKTMMKGLKQCPYTAVVDSSD